MRPRLFTLVAVNSVAAGLSAAVAEPPTTATPRMTAPTAKSLALAASGPTLVVGNGALIESIDPASGRVVASIKPVDVADLTWKRLDRRGRFLLAEGWSELRKGPIPYFERGLVLFDDKGAVLWARTQAFPLNGFAMRMRGHEVRSAIRVLIAKADNVPLIESQERIRIDIFLRDNLP